MSTATEPEAQKEGAVRRTAMLVEVTPVERGDFRPELIALGTVRPSQDVVLEPRVRGQVLSIGEGFVPGCGQVMGIILDPVDWRQPVIVWIPVPCTEDETAWGGDFFGTPMDFPGSNWAIYFAYTIQ